MIRMLPLSQRLPVLPQLLKLSLPLLLAACAVPGAGPGGGVDAGAAAAAAAARENAAAARATAESLPRPAPLVMMGSLTYRARTALPPDAVALVELRDVAVPGPGGAGRVVAEQRIPLAGKQVPVPFSVHVERDTLLAAGKHQLRGGIVVADRAIWVTPPLPIDITVDRVDAGELLMQPYQGEAFAVPAAATAK